MRLLIGAAVCAAMSMISTAQGAELQESVLYQSGEGGYDTYRIPAVTVSKPGTLLAFCEGRKNGRGDAGDIDVLLRRSTDNGETWGPVQVLVDDGGNTCGNPCPIVDRASGDIVLLITKNGGDHHENKIQMGQAPHRTAWVLRSQDDGLTWSAPRDISESVRKPEYRWYATGPGHGIQLTSGRMIAPCDHSTGPASDQQFAHVIYSDDAGQTWTLGGALPGRTNESIAVELDEASLYLNVRNNFGLKQRAYAVSHDQGISFQPLAHDPVLVEPTCQASALLYAPATKDDPAKVLFSNPASAKRENMTVRLSLDGAKTWKYAKTLWPGPAAYSDLVLAADGRIVCLYERGAKSPYETITLARFPITHVAPGILP